MAEKTTIKVSLSRMHKIADRLKDLSSKLFQESSELARNEAVSGYAGEAQIARFEAKAARSMELSEKAERYVRAAIEVRAAIGRENETRGVNALLTSLEGVKRLTAHNKELLEHAKTAGIPPAELASYKPIAGTESRFGGGLSISILGAERRAIIEKRLGELQRESFSLSDRIAEQNAPRMDFEMDADIAAEVQGA